MGIRRKGREVALQTLYALSNIYEVITINPLLNQKILKIKKKTTPKKIALIRISLVPTVLGGNAYKS